MKKYGIIATMFAMVLTLSGCFWGERVTVPPAFEGKVLTKNGYLPDTYPPSSFRLATCWQPGAVCPKIVLVDRSDNGLKEEFQLFMPKNQLNLTFDLRMTASVRENSTDAILNRISPSYVDQFDAEVVGFNKIYTTYAQPIIRDAVRSVMAEYSIDEIASSRDAVNAEIRKRLEGVLASTPISLKTAGLARVQYPEVITKRKEQAEERRIEIEQEEARKQVKLVQLQTQLETAKAERAIRREKAEAAAEENRIAAAAITPEYLEYKKLEVMSEMAQNGSTVFVPFDALGTVGLQQKIFNKN